jgi:peroxiredoxin
MKLTPGELITEIELPSIDGETFSIKTIRGKKSLLTFYRFATCPFCNLRIHEITERYNELGENFEIVAIFNSSQDYLANVMEKHTAPFTILADENFKYFSKYEVEKSISKFMIGSIVGFFRILKASSKGYFPLELKGMTIVPVDVLINETGVIEKVYYGKNTTDHMSFDEIKKFSLP